ncbi:hypothetical protein NGM37_40680, partial [Streptomyces sp. TRM76130]|nr:hypothetical protein [Streptomyces sp. TRM76130]
SGGGPGDGRTTGGARQPTAPDAPSHGTRWARLNATAGYGTSWARGAGYAVVDPAGGRSGEGREDTVTLFIGRPGYEREALQADPLAVIVRAPDGTGGGYVNGGGGDGGGEDGDKDGDGAGGGGGDGGGGGGG